MSQRQISLGQFLNEAQRDLEKQLATLQAFSNYQQQARKAGVVKDFATPQEWQAALELYVDLRE